MARRILKEPEEIPELDRVEGFAHPRETTVLVGQEGALCVAARAIRSGRPPAAWLFTGPPGVGKATLAYRVARYLLAFGSTDKGAPDLSVPANNTAAIQLAAASHPGLMVLKRRLNDQGKPMSVLSVAEVRKLQGFFGLTSGAGGWRVAIVDTADDMNDNAANGLLKMLEEPPTRAMLLLVSNTPGRLLPTIRSRCQRLELRPLADAMMEKELSVLLPDRKPKDRSALIRLSTGSIGMALRLAGGEGPELAREADRLLDAARTPDFAAILALGDRITRISDGLDSFGSFLEQALTDRIRAHARDGAIDLDRWVNCLGRLTELFGRTAALHMEPRQTLLSTARALEATSRRAGPV